MVEWDALRPFCSITRIDRGSLRASAYLYNTEDEVRLFAETLVEAVKLGDNVQPPHIDGELETDLDFIQQLDSSCFLCNPYCCRNFCLHDIHRRNQPFGPSALVLEEEDFDRLVQPMDEYSEMV